MVKLGFYVVEKCYKNRVYKHELVLLRFPKELHEILRCLRDKQLEIKVTREENTTHITLIDKQEK
jgi:hypothetical protein